MPASGNLSITRFVHSIVGRVTLTTEDYRVWEQAKTQMPGITSVT